MRRPAFAKPSGAELLQLVGVMAAIVLAGIVNVLGARHFIRWDVTRDKRWSLSPVTVELLHGLESRVDVWAIAGPGDPFERSLRQLLVAYEAQTTRLEVHWIDPDRDAVQLVDLQRRFGLEAAQAEDGRVAADAVVIVASGQRHWFLTAQDLYEASSDDVHVKPREERALTLAMRSVLGGEKAKLCFTAGHGELTLEPGKDEHEWLGALRDLLDKSNYELTTVDVTAPGAHEPFAGCAVVVVAGAHAPFAPEEDNRLRMWLLEGGSLLAAVGPMQGATESGMVPAGLDASLSPFGIALDDDLVHDTDPAVAIPDTHGEEFFVAARAHAVTAGLVPGSGEAQPPKAVVFFARSLRHVSPPGAAPASDLLVTTETAYGKASIAGASAWTDAPPREAGDAKGPFALAMASERPRLSADAPHGPRVVVLGSRFALTDENWRQPRPLRGMAFLVDSAVSWLAARPAVVDIPDKAEVAAGMRVSEEIDAEVRRFAVLWMPLAALLLGVAVWLWRRSTENRPYQPPRRDDA